MEATNIMIPTGIFNFYGQARIDTFVIDIESLLSEQRRYDAIMVNKYRLSLEAIRHHSNEFSYWQHRKSIGRPPMNERDLLIAFLVRQLFDATFRETGRSAGHAIRILRSGICARPLGPVQEERQPTLADVVEEVLFICPRPISRKNSRHRH